MHLPKFEHLRAASLNEATQLLKQYGPKAALVAGGTDLYPRMKYGVACPEVVISLKGVFVRPPTVAENGDLHIDALMTLADLARSRMVLERIPLLAEAALSVGSNQVRHMGTLGGNLCLETRCSYYNQSHTFQFVEPCFKRHGDRCYLIPGGKKCWAVFSADTAPSLISMGALVNITGSEENRQLPLEKLYTGDSLNPFAISETEVVTEVIVPDQAFQRASAFVKFSMRGGIEFAALNVAVVLSMEDNGSFCKVARIAVGGISAAPVRMVKAEKAVGGQYLSEDVLQQVADTAASEATPCLHHGYSRKYLRESLRVHIFRALTSAARRARRD